MAVNLKNRQWQDYLDDSGNHWNILAESGGAGASVDGHGAFDSGNPVFGKITSRRHPRYVVATNSATFRTVKFIVYTPTAYAAIGGGDAITVPVPGSATADTYNVTQKIGEKMPFAKTSRNLADA